MKCAETLQKYIEYRRQCGTQAEIISALSYLLPSSPIYPVLSSLPPPDPSNPTTTTILDIQSAVYNSLPIIDEIVERTEKIEKETFSKEFEKRRTRLNAGTPSQIRKALGLEIWSKSKVSCFRSSCRSVLMDSNSSQICTAKSSAIRIRRTRKGERRNQSCFNLSTSIFVPYRRTTQ